MKFAPPSIVISSIAAAFVSSHAFVPLASAQVIVDRDTGAADRAAARRANVQAARAEVERARAQLQAASTRIRATFAANPELTASEKALAEARAAFEAARQPIVDRLAKDNPQYAEAMREELDAAAKLRVAQATAPANTGPTTGPAPVDYGIPDDGIGLDEEQGDANVDPATTKPIATPEQVRAAQARLDQKTKMRKLEDDAIAADPNAAQAKAQLDAAGAKRAALQAQFQAALLNDPEYRQAKADLDAARARVTQAAAAN